MCKNYRHLYTSIFGGFRKRFAVLTSSCCRYMQMYTLATGKFMKPNGTLGIFDD